MTLSLSEARKNDEIIAIADSQILRWIDELNGIVDADSQAKSIRSQIKYLRTQPNSTQNRHQIRRLYDSLDEIQFKPDYMCLVIDKPKDYYTACKGYMINGVKYVRLLGTNGGIKNSTIVFVSERLAGELRRRIENGRDQTKELVTAKLEAYKALVCSASTPVSAPRGLLIVNDAETNFLSDIIYLSDEDGGEPVMEMRRDEPITLNASDGFGLMLPSIAQRWSEELGLKYVVSGVNSRMSFEKGMLVTFDFVDFAEKVAGTYMVKDAWGNLLDVRQVEVIMTTSMVKLWDSYESCEDYLRNCAENHYTFGVAKVAPESLENERNLNYQFIQSFQLDDDDIDALIAPTVNEIKDVLGGDWRKTILFLRGASLSEKNVAGIANDYIKAIMIDKRVLNDPFVQNAIYQLIRKRINDAKVGVIKVHANYSIVCGDPYLLCQSVFGLEKTGLLQPENIYNEYWADRGSDRLLCFRAPMTCHNNIRAVHAADTPELRYWFRYIKTMTVFNSWDTATIALNGCDFDADIVMLTDNRVLVDRHRPLPALMCAQRKAEKRVSAEDDFIRSNIANFGNDIGQTTNWVTSMFEVAARYPDNSKERDVLSYRILCGQLYQQNAIDKAKGIICNPMPRDWHDRMAASKIEDEDLRELYRCIAADKKPYFMRYVYPDLMKRHNTYLKNTDRNALREFQMTVQELKSVPYNRLTERQREFLLYYDRKMPVGVGDCIMNKICRRFEEAFDGHVKRFAANTNFDYRFMKSRSQYTQKQYRNIKALYDEYNHRIRSFALFANTERVDEYDAKEEFNTLNEAFLRRCSEVCPNSDTLCDILLDMCYTKSSTKRFVWEMCGDEIIRHLLSSHGGYISFPTPDVNGEIVYRGERFTVKTTEIGDDML